MSEPGVIELVKQGVLVVLAVIAAVGAWSARVQTKKTHDTVNSRMDRLLALEKALSLKLGVAQGRAEQVRDDAAEKKRG